MRDHFTSLFFKIQVLFFKITGVQNKVTYIQNDTLLVRNRIKEKLENEYELHGVKSCARK